MASAGGGAPGVVGGLGASSPPPPEASRRHHSLPPRSASPEPPSEKEERVRAARAPAAMASAGGGAPGAVDGLGASSPPRPRPRRAAPARAVVAFAAHGRGDLRESLREVLERIFAEGCVDVMSAASCVGASSSPPPPPPPPPPRRAATPPALLASHGHGGVDLREALPELFERLVTDGYLHLASPPSSLPFRFCTIGRFRASYLMNLNAQEDLRLINHKDMAQSSYHQWKSAFDHHNPRIEELDVDGINSNAREKVDDLSDALALFITKPKLYAQPSLVLSDIGLKSHVYATRDVNSTIWKFDHASSAQSIGSRTRAPQFCLTTDYMSGGSRFSFLHHEYGTRTDSWMTRGVKPVFHFWSSPPPRWTASPPAMLASHGHGGGNLRESLRELFERLFTEGCVHLASPPSGSPCRSCTIARFRASYLMNLNAQEDLWLINMKDMAESYYPQSKSTFNHHNPRIQEMNVEGTNLNAHEELDGLSDALALFIAKPKLYAQPSLLLSDIGLKSHVYATRDVNSAIREFDHASSAQLIGSHTSASQFCITTDRADNMSGGSRFSFLHHEHGTRIDRWTTPEILTCRECETSEAKIQYLIHWNSILQQQLDELYEHNIAAVKSTDISGHDTGALKPELVEDSITDLKEVKSVREKSKTEASKDNAPEPAPNTDTESAGNYQEEKLMEKFNKMLVDCVFFAMPQILIFFPRYQAPKEKPAEKPAEQRLSLMAIIQHVDNQSNEKTAVVFFFVMFVSVWLLGLVLSLFGRGSRCTAAVSMLTLWTVGSTLAFIDYMLCKCLPEDGLFTWLFRGHWLAMSVGIAYIWFTYVRVPRFPSIKLSSCQLKYPRLPKFPSFQLPGCQLTYPRLPELPSFQLPGCQRVFGSLRGWCKSPVPAVVHDSKAEDELKEPMLPPV